MVWQRDRSSLHEPTLDEGKLGVVKLALTSREGCPEVDLDDLGDGPALVLIHGGPGLDRSYFRPWFDAMAVTRRVVSWDLSRTCERSVSAWSRELFGVMDALSIETADVLGHSFGATVAVAAALEESARVRSLVLVSPPSLGPNRNQLAHVLSRGTREQIAGFVGFRATTQAAFDAHWRLMLPLYFAQATSPHLEALSAMTVDLEVWKDGVASLDGATIASQLSRLAAPTLVCGGMHDWLSDADVIAGWTARLPNARQHVFSQSAHFAFMEEPELFLRVIRGFLAR